jgi:hypothetical protein
MASVILLIPIVICSLNEERDRPAGSQEVRKVKVEAESREVGHSPRPLHCALVTRTLRQHRPLCRRTGASELATPPARRELIGPCCIDRPHQEKRCISVVQDSICYAAKCQTTHTGAPMR